MTTSARPNVVTSARTPAAPPVYRPQPLPRALQRKTLRPVAPQSRSLPLQLQTSVRNHPNIRANGTIQLLKKDAQEFADKNGIKITATHQSVTEYVNNSANGLTLRKGLLAAWNLNSASNWIIPEPSNFGSTNPYHYSNFGTYQNWTTSTSGVNFTTPFGAGNVSACHKRGAPKLGSNATDWGGKSARLGDTYNEYVRGLRSGGLTDRQIATALLAHNDGPFASQLEKRAAAMIFATVYLAEEWRKQGAAKIYRAMLRAISQGLRSFDDFKDDYSFIQSAQEGRQLVARFYNVFNSDSDVTDLSATEQTYYNCMSPAQEDDFSSDDEMRTDDKKNLKGKRLFAEKHTG